MVIKIPRVYSRNELAQILSPPDNEARIARFRDRLEITEEELLKKQVEGERVRRLMLTLADVRVAVRRCA